MSKTSLYSILLIVAWSLLVHIPGMTSPLLDYQAYRQCQTAAMAKNYVLHGMHFLSPELDSEGPPVRAGTEFPIYSYLLALLYKVFGVHEILGRLLSCLFAAWGAIYLYRFVRPRLGERIALWSAIVLCSIPVHVYFTRSVQPEPMALWGLLGFLYYADQWLNRYGKASAWRRALLLGAIAPMLKLPYLYVLFPLWGYLGYEKFGPQLWRSRLWVTLMVMIMGLTAAWYYFARSAPVVILPLSMQDHLTNLAPIFGRNLWQAQFVSRLPELVTTYSGFLFALIGIYFFRKAKSFNFFIFWLITALFSMVLLGRYGLIHRYTLLPVAPAAAVWIACGMTTAWEYAKRSAVLRVIVILGIVGMPLHAALRIKHWYRVEYPYLTEVRELLAHISRPDDLILVSTHEKPVHLYYIDHYGYSVGPSDWTPDEVDRRIRLGVKFALIPMEDNARRLKEWRTCLAARGNLVKETEEYLLYRIDGSTSRVARQL